MYVNQVSPRARAHGAQKDAGGKTAYHTRRQRRPYTSMMLYNMFCVCSLRVCVYPI